MGDFFKNVIFINHEAHPVMEELAHEFHGAVGMGVHSLSTLPFWLALGGVALGLGGLLRRYSLQVRVWLRQLWLRRWRFSHPLSTAPPCFSSLGLRPVLCRAA